MNQGLSIPVAFVAGVVSFLSPCVLPLVPGYISMLSGASMEELKAGASAGLVGRPACLCFATENTHGYEVTPLAALENCVKVLLEHFVNASE